MPNLKRVVLPLLAISILSFPPHALANKKSTNGKKSVTVGIESQKLSGIVTERLKPAVYKKTVKAYGEVVDLGSLIKLRTSYLTAEAAEQKVHYQLSVSRKEYARTLKLFHSSKYVSLERLQNAEAAYHSDLADSEAAREESSDIRSTLILNWGRVITDWVTERYASSSALGNGRLSLVVITITAGSLTGLPPRAADVVDASGNVVECRFVSTSPKSDQAIQGVNYFYSVARTPSLPSGLNIVARLPVGKTFSGVVVPSSSVVWWHGKAWAYVETDSVRFTRISVDTTMPSGQGWFEKRGIRPGNRIVTRGAQLLFSQEFKSRIEGDND